MFRRDISHRIEIWASKEVVNGETSKSPLLSLHCLGRSSFKLGAKYSIPEAAGDAKSVFIIGKVMRKMILLQFLVVRRQTKRITNG